jgi:hypothetical protein
MGGTRMAASDDLFPHQDPVTPGKVHVTPYSFPTPGQPTN